MRLKYISALFAVAMTTACDDKVDWDGPDLGPNPEPPGSELPAIIAGVSPNGAVGLFPHDRFTMDDPTTFTGRRVEFTEAHDPTLPNEKPLIQSLVRQMNGLDGFGTIAGAWIRYSEPLDTNTVVADENAFIGYMSGSTPVIIPSEALVTPTQVLLRPHIAAPANSENFFFSTRGMKGKEGQDVVASDELKAILRGETGSDELAIRTKAIADALVAEGIVGSLEDITALGIYTSQSIHEQSLEIAEQISSLGIVGTPNDDCQRQTNYTMCTFDYTMPDYVGWDQIIDPDAIDTEDTYTITATVFLPNVGTEPFEIPYDPSVGFPVTIFGHGLTGRAVDARMIANHASPMGVAVVSIDAPQHGAHPRSNGYQDLDLILSLFGIIIEDRPDVSTLHLRDGWRLSNLDKLALIEALKSGMDFDGDETTVELDMSRLSYLGGSLGAIQGAEFLALSTDISGGLFAVGGARLSDIVRFGPIFELAMFALMPRATKEELHRMYTLLQIGVEVGDGANWAQHIMKNRLRGSIIPDIAMLAAHPDGVVPSETAIVLARSLGATIVGEAVQPDSMLPVSEGPVSGNHESGRTVGYLQVDWIWKASAGEYRQAEHASASDSAEGIAYWLEAYRTLINDGKMSLSNPYPVNGAPPRP